VHKAHKLHDQAVYGCSNDIALSCTDILSHAFLA
jgi:hypothetical protein